MINEEKDKKEYELAVLLKSEDDLASVRALLAQHNAESVSEPRAKRLGLAYEIKGFTEAVFASATFKAYGDEVKDLEHDLTARQDIIRFMITKTPAPSTRPSSPIVSAEDRPRPVRATFSGETSSRPASRPLSNEALEKKIEEILG